MLCALRGKPGELQRALIGLGATVAEEGVLQIPRRDLCKKLGKLCLQVARQGADGHRHTIELFFHGRHDLGVPMANVEDRGPAGAVEILLAVSIVDHGTPRFPLHGGDVGEAVEALEAGVDETSVFLQRLGREAVRIIW